MRQTIGLSTEQIRVIVEGNKIIISNLMINPQRLVDNIRSTLDKVRSSLPEENVKDALEFLEHGEWGLAFSLICMQLYEYDITIDEQTYTEIEQIGLEMKINPQEWTILKELVQHQ